MSASAASLAADIQRVADGANVNRLIQAISFVLLYYDFILTLPEEVERYWTRSLSWASFFFFLNRYISVVCYLPIVYEFYAYMPESRCRVLQLYHQMLLAITQCVVAILLMMRTYALFNRNRRVLVFLASIAAAGGAVTVWSILGARGGDVVDSPDVSPLVGCDLRISVRQGYYLAAAWSSILVFDAAVFGLTLWQSLRAGRMWSHSLFHVILRDGTVYFGVLGICYMSNILTYALALPKHKGVLTTLTNVISTSLISRMMLNIRNPELLELPHRWPSEHFEI